MEAAQTLEAKPGQNTAQFDAENLHNPMEAHVEAFSKAAGVQVDQTQAKPDSAQEIDLDQMRQLANQPIETEGGLEGAKEQWDVEVNGKTSREDGAKGFLSNLMGKMVKQEERKLKGEESGSNNNS